MHTLGHNDGVGYIKSQIVIVFILNGKRGQIVTLARETATLAKKLETKHIQQQF